jgi:hypothetical protein
MKAQLRPLAQPSKFESFQVIVTIESLEDLHDLWTRTNAAASTFDERLGRKANTDSSFPLWRVLDEKINKR